MESVDNWLNTKQIVDWEIKGSLMIDKPWVLNVKYESGLVKSHYSNSIQELINITKDIKK